MFHEVSGDISPVFFATKVLNEVEPVARFKVGMKLLERQLLVLSIASQVMGQAESANAKGRHHREAGNDIVVPGAGQGEEKEEDTCTRLTKKMEAAGMPPEARKITARELAKIKQMETSQSFGPEHQKAVTYGIKPPLLSS